MRFPLLSFLFTGLVCSASVCATPIDAVRAEIARLQALPPVGQTLVPQGAALKEGASGVATALLKQRLRELGYPANHSDEFDPSITLAVRDYQKDQGLKQDGVVDRQTRYNLNLDNAAKLKLLQWQLPQMEAIAAAGGERYIVVNIPAFTLTAYQSGQPVLQSKVVIGRPDRQTPLLATRLVALQFNPSWSAPPTVVRNDLIKQGKLDTAKLREKKLVMLGADGERVDPEEVAANPDANLLAYRYYQEPGDRNALGKLKFVLTDSNNIYLHDTPQKSAFERETRSASSGCVRVQRWLDLAAWVQQKTGDEISHKVAAGRSVYQPVNEPVKVYLVYWPAEVEGQQLRWRDDIYGLFLRPEGVNVALQARSAAAKGVGRLARN
ncbi:L,D-transpeptidase family protein [Chitinilyticum piscinae]|uniref:L,D-transpeptidase family protein n=1 Tax=Chitinilyticum piscinae TaxID=2866724 RepID=A0A8J7FJF9_9NEIS|nr:L,D-transpeptidase family protein [Chitinilyticum piscinae]MBE9610323.1 L,D-transpeptidase family protein [Chitinilyticum piscinae]